MAFYDEMAEFAKEILSPESQGGLGQLTVELIRSTFVKNPDAPWEDPQRLAVSEQLKAAAFAITQTSGYEQDGTTVLVGDTRIIAAIPETLDWVPGGEEEAVITVKINGGIEMQTILVKTIPEAGLPVALVIIARGPKQ